MVIKAIVIKSITVIVFLLEQRLLGLTRQLQNMGSGAGAVHYVDVPTIIGCSVIGLDTLVQISFWNLIAARWVEG